MIDGYNFFQCIKILSGCNLSFKISLAEMKISCCFSASNCTFSTFWVIIKYFTIELFLKCIKIVVFMKLFKIYHQANGDRVYIELCSVIFWEKPFDLLAILSSMAV